MFLCWQFGSRTLENEFTNLLLSNQSNFGIIRAWFCRIRSGHITYTNMLNLETPILYLPINNILNSWFSTYKCLLHYNLVWFWGSHRPHDHSNFLRYWSMVLGVQSQKNRLWYPLLPRLLDVFIISSLLAQTTCSMSGLQEWRSAAPEFIVCNL